MGWGMYDDIINGIIKREGGYVNDPADSGGETMYGITVAVARRRGYTGAMRELPRALAEAIYTDQYILDPNFDEVYNASKAVGEEVIDTGVNLGTGMAARILQRALNTLTDTEITVDGNIGTNTITALYDYLRKRGAEGEKVLTRTLNALQAHYYITLAETSKKNKKFIYGWIANRC